MILTMNTPLHEWLQLVLDIHSGARTVEGEPTSGEPQLFLEGGRPFVVVPRLVHDTELDALVAWLGQSELHWAVDSKWSFDRQLCLRVAERILVYVNLELGVIDKAVVYLGERPAP
ncbi:MAG: hypothetical protein KC656_32625 [Myxococcales bacterium]|nr:hypothetical protein [Myxococcales bacterium]